MSWSVNAKGAPHVLIAALAAAFNQARENCKALDHEVQQVTAAESLVNNELKFHNETGASAVSVTAFGSAYRNPTAGDSQVSVVVSRCKVEEINTFEPAPQPTTTHFPEAPQVLEPAAPAAEPAPADAAAEPAPAAEPPHTE